MTIAFTEHAWQNYSQHIGNIAPSEGIALCENRVSDRIKFLPGCVEHFNPILSLFRGSLPATPDGIGAGREPSLIFIMLASEHDKNQGVLHLLRDSAFS